MREGVGNHLLVVRGEHRGRVGEIVEVKSIGCGLINYCMTFGDDKDIAYEIPSEDCRDYVPGSINLEAPFDITSYLSTSTMKEVALEVYKSKMELYVDNVLENRSEYGLGNIADQVLGIIAKKFIDEKFDDMVPYFTRKIEKIIESDKPLTDDEDAKSFGGSVQCYLEQSAAKYIEEHKEEMWKIMEASIINAAKKMATDNMADVLSNRLQATFRAALRDIIEKLEAK